jgi:polysaccharide biosynthesis/export protein
MKRLLFCFLFLTTLHSKEFSYLLGPDDVIQVKVYREDDMNRDVRVSDNGFVSFPLIGKFFVKDKTTSQVEEELAKLLLPYLKKPQVSIFIKEYSMVTITGQVIKPGACPLKEGLTVLEAIALSGGFTKIASRNNVYVIGKNGSEKKMIKIRAADINKSGDRSKDVFLERGDIVFVPESLF